MNRGRVILAVLLASVVASLAFTPIAGAIPPLTSDDERRMLKALAAYDEIDAALDIAERQAQQSEGRAQRSPSRTAWRRAAQDRAASLAAYTDAVSALRVFTQAIRNDPGWSAAAQPFRRDLAQAFARQRRVVLERRKRAIRLLAGVLIRVKRPDLDSPLPRAQNRVKKVEKAAARSARAANRALRTSKVPPPDLAQIWAEHELRVRSLVPAISFAAGALRKGLTPRARRAQLIYLARLAVAYRKETVTTEKRIRALGGACSDQMLLHLGNQRRGQQIIKEYIQAYRKGQRRAVAASRREYRELRTVLGALEGQIEQCLASPPEGTPVSSPAPAPPPTPPPPGSGLPSRFLATSSAVCPASLVDKGPATDPEKKLVTSGDLFNAVLARSPVDGKPLAIDCNYSLDGSSDSDQGTIRLVQVLMYFPGDGVNSATTSGQCGTSTPAGNRAQSANFYLEATGSAARLDDPLGTAQAALAKAEGAGVAIPCTWTG